MIAISNQTPEEAASELARLVAELRIAGRNDLLLRAIGVPVLEELRLEASRNKLSRLSITPDFRLILTDYDHREVVLNPVHKAVYLFFLNHPEGIALKRLRDHRDELLRLYMATARTLDKQTITESVDMLIDPLNNSINEKCSRIKAAFLAMMDPYMANYYIVSSHVQRHVEGSSRVWNERLKVITLPRHLVVNSSPVPLLQ